MLIIDSLLVCGIRFVLDKVAAAVETEMNDDTALRERLLAAQMQLELGEMSQDGVRRRWRRTSSPGSVKSESASAAANPRPSRRGT